MDKWVRSGEENIFLQFVEGVLSLQKRVPVPLIMLFINNVNEFLAAISHALFSLNILSQLDISG